jgi:phytoene dehydrogenase-like protein
MRPSNSEYDVIVIGAGMGGLISACRLGQAGKKVLLVEKLGFLGGRFSAFPYHGAEISSRAFHTFPHGDYGPFAQALRRLGIKIKVPQEHIFAAFYLENRQQLAKTGLDVFKVAPEYKDK